jgi:hypothetical protein
MKTLAVFGFVCHVVFSSLHYILHNMIGWYS